MANQLQEDSIYVTFQHSVDNSQSLILAPFDPETYKEDAFWCMPEGCKPILAIKVKSLKGASND